MADDRRSLIAETLAAHVDELSRVLGDALRATPAVLKCACGEWSMPFDHLGITEVVAEHGLHRADAILAALALAELDFAAGVAAGRDPSI